MQPLTLKSLSETRWSARADATKAIVSGYDSIKNALQDIEDDSELTPESRLDAQTLADKMETLEIALMATMWNTILSRFNSCSKAIQAADADLKKIVDLLASLESYLESLRNNPQRFEELEQDAKDSCGNTSYQVQRERKRNTRFDDNPIPNRTRSTEGQEVQSAREKFICETFYVVLDQLSVALKERKAVYDTSLIKFGVIVNLCSLSDASLKEEATKLICAYPQDLGSSFTEEIVQFAAFAKLRSCSNPSQQAVLLYDEGLTDTFPGVYVALRIFLSMAVTNCSGERAFSKLARIKNDDRTSTTDKRLKALCLLDAESDILRKVEFDDLIADFVDAKCRKRSFL